MTFVTLDCSTWVSGHIRHKLLLFCLYLPSYLSRVNHWNKIGRTLRDTGEIKITAANPTVKIQMSTPQSKFSDIIVHDSFRLGIIISKFSAKIGHKVSYWCIKVEENWATRRLTLSQLTIISENGAKKENQTIFLKTNIL